MASSLTILVQILSLHRLYLCFDTRYLVFWFRFRWRRGVDRLLPIGKLISNAFTLDELTQAGFFQLKDRKHSHCMHALLIL